MFKIIPLKKLEHLMMNPTFLRLISALRPNPRFWLLQGIVVPLVALLGGLYIATEAHAGEFDQIYSDYVVQSDASKAFPQASTILRLERAVAKLRSIKLLVVIHKILG